MRPKNAPSLGGVSLPRTPSASPPSFVSPSSPCSCSSSSSCFASNATSLESVSSSSSSCSTSASSDLAATSMASETFPTAPIHPAITSTPNTNTTTTTTRTTATITPSPVIATTSNSAIMTGTVTSATVSGSAKRLFNRPIIAPFATTSTTSTTTATPTTATTTTPATTAPMTTPVISTTTATKTTFMNTPSSAYAAAAAAAASFVKKTVDTTTILRTTTTSLPAPSPSPLTTNHLAAIAALARAGLAVNGSSSLPSSNSISSAVSSNANSGVNISQSVVVPSSNASGTSASTPGSKDKQSKTSSFSASLPPSPFFSPANRKAVTKIPASVPSAPSLSTASKSLVYLVGETEIHIRREALLTYRRKNLPEEKVAGTAATKSATSTNATKAANVTSVMASKTDSTSSGREGKKRSRQPSPNLDGPLLRLPSPRSEDIHREKVGKTGRSTSKSDQIGELLKREKSPQVGRNVKEEEITPRRGKEDKLKPATRRTEISPQVHRASKSRERDEKKRNMEATPERGPSPRVRRRHTGDDDKTTSQGKDARGSSTENVDDEDDEVDETVDNRCLPINATKHQAIVDFWLSVNEYWSPPSEEALATLAAIKPSQPRNWPSKRLKKPSLRTLSSASPIAVSYSSLPPSQFRLMLTLLPNDKSFSLTKPPFTSITSSIPPPTPYFATSDSCSARRPRSFSTPSSTTATPAIVTPTPITAPATTHTIATTTTIPAPTTTTATTTTTASTTASTASTTTASTTPTATTTTPTTTTTLIAATARNKNGNNTNINTNNSTTNNTNNKNNNTLNNTRNHNKNNILGPAVALTTTVDTLATTATTTSTIATTTANPSDITCSVSSLQGSLPLPSLISPWPNRSLYCLAPTERSSTCLGVESSPADTEAINQPKICTPSVIKTDDSYLSSSKKRDELRNETTSLEPSSLSRVASCTPSLSTKKSYVSPTSVTTSLSTLPTHESEKSDESESEEMRYKFSYYSLALRLDTATNDISCWNYHVDAAHTTGGVSTRVASTTSNFAPTPAPTSSAIATNTIAPPTTTVTTVTTTIVPATPTTLTTIPSPATATVSSSLVPSLRTALTSSSATPPLRTPPQKPLPPSSPAPQLPAHPLASASSGTSFSVSATPPTPPSTSLTLKTVTSRHEHEDPSSSSRIVLPIPPRQTNPAEKEIIHTPSGSVTNEQGICNSNGNDAMKKENFIVPSPKYKHATPPLPPPTPLPPPFPPPSPVTPLVTPKRTLNILFNEVSQVSPISPVASPSTPKVKIVCSSSEPQPRETRSMRSKNRQSPADTDSSTVVSPTTFSNVTGSSRSSPQTQQILLPKPRILNIIMSSEHNTRSSGIPLPPTQKVRTSVSPLSSPPTARPTKKNKTVSSAASKITSFFASQHQNNGHQQGQQQKQLEERQEPSPPPESASPKTRTTPTTRGQALRDVEALAVHSARKRRNCSCSTVRKRKPVKKTFAVDKSNHSSPSTGSAASPLSSTPDHFLTQTPRATPPNPTPKLTTTTISPSLTTSISTTTTIMPVTIELPPKKRTIPKKKPETTALIQSNSAIVPTQSPLGPLVPTLVAPTNLPLQLFVVGVNAFSNGEIVHSGFDEITAELHVLEEMLRLETQALCAHKEKLLALLRADQDATKLITQRDKEILEEYRTYETGRQRAKLAELHRQKDVINMAEPKEIVCGICGDGDVEAQNDILLCDLCDVAVHQVCYGTEEIPPHHWFCDRCAATGFEAREVCCVICNLEGGAMKRTSTNQWAHVVCGLCIPELYFEDPFRLKAIAGFEGIPLARKKLQCGICKDAGITAKAEFNSCIQCTFKTCCKAFHPHCARLKGYQMNHEAVGGMSGGVEAYCFSHRTELPKYKNFALTALDAKPDTEILLCTACLCMGSTDSDREWFLLRCDQCEVAVHASCMRIDLETARALLKSGGWLCARCVARKQGPSNAKLTSTCTICLQNEGGQIMQCIDGSWEHMLCRLWTFGQLPSKGLLRSDAASSVQSGSKNDRCCICQQRGGSFISCAYAKCSKTFHALCAAQKGYKMVKASPLPQVFCPPHITKSAALPPSLPVSPLSSPFSDHLPSAKKRITEKKSAGKVPATPVSASCSVSTSSPFCSPCSSSSPSTSTAKTKLTTIANKAKLATNNQTETKATVSEPESSVARPTHGQKGLSHLTRRNNGDSEKKVSSVDRNSKRRRRRNYKRKIDENEPKQAPEEEEWDPDTLVCYCRQRYDDNFAYIMCDHCMDWVHFKCADLHGEEKAKAKAAELWFCGRDPCVLAGEAYYAGTQPN